MNHKALLFSLILTVFSALQPAQAQLGNDILAKGIEVKNCTTSVINVTLDKPCSTNCTRSVPGGESAEFKTGIGSSTMIHVTDVSGTKYDYDTGILTNPVITRWFFWDGKELSPKKGKCSRD